MTCAVRMPPSAIDIDVPTCIQRHRQATGFSSDPWIALKSDVRHVKGLDDELHDSF